MPKAAVTEQEIEKAEKLSAQREFGASLVMLQEMLTRANDVQVRMRLLFDVVTCSTWLNLDQSREDAIRELKKTGPLKEPVTVRLAGGTYALAHEVRFGPEDSGTVDWLFADTVKQLYRKKAECHVI